MAYGVKYTADFRNTRNQDYRVKFLLRDYSGTSKEIATLCGCALEIQGAQNDVIAPIVKTQLRVSMVDAWDQAETSTKKYGDWQEFFTPDATLYKVVLCSLTGQTETTIWTGYITPDNWKEELGYRNAITITARDNIGHLRDFPFDMEGDEFGLVNIQALIGAAMNKVEFPMLMTYPEGEHGDYILPATGVSGWTLTEAYVNVCAFEDMDWYEALERTLESIGYTLRFIGGNRFCCTALRNIVIHTGAQTVEFYGGTMELAPAIKLIEDECDYGLNSEIPLEILAGIEFSAATTYRAVTEGNTLPGGGTVSVPEHDAPANSVTDPGKSGWSVGSLLLNPASKQPDSFLKRSEGEDGWSNYAFIPANHVNGGIARTAFRFWTRTAGVKLTFNLTAHAMSVRMSGSETGKVFDPHYSLSEIKYQVAYLNEDQTVIRYWDGGAWGTTQTDLTKTYDSQNKNETVFDIELGDCQDIASGLVVVYFYNIKYKCWSAAGHGAYARVESALVELVSTKAIGKNKVTTVNNDDYNVRMERRPMFGALSQEVGFVLPRNYENGLFYYPLGSDAPQLYPYMVYWTQHSTSDTVPLPVAIHQQILCFYHGAARVLSGRLAPVNKAKLDFDSTFVYKGVSYILQGGTLDLFSGIMEGAVLREYIDFDDLWENGSVPENTETPRYPSGVGGGGRYSGGNYGSDVSRERIVSLIADQTTIQGLYAERAAKDANGNDLDWFVPVTEGNVLHLQLNPRYAGLFALGWIGDGGVGTGGGGGGGTQVAWGTPSGNAIPLTVEGVTQSLVLAAALQLLAEKAWVQSQGYLLASSLKTINQQSLVGSGDITIQDGTDGKSAYQIWLDEGNVGSESDFLASLKGDPGSSQAYPFSLYNGLDSSSTTEALTALQGKLLNEKINAIRNYEDIPEWVALWVDSEGRILIGIKADGSIEWGKGVPAPIRERLEALEAKSGFEIFDDAENRLEMTIDESGRIVSYRDSDGILHEKGLTAKTVKADSVKTEGLELSDGALLSLSSELRRVGFSGGTGDWSEEASLQIAMPRLAVINLTTETGEPAQWPQTKTVDYHYWMQFYDLQGNYFKKRVIFNAQGNSTLSMPKKNGAIDICNDEWEGDDTFVLKIGDWVPQDSFHLKAYYADYFLGVCAISYKLMDQIVATRDVFEDRDWKKGLIDREDVGIDSQALSGSSDKIALDNGARCFPDGFPCIVYLDGVFYGIYSFQLKKHRDNYQMKKSEAKHIHLDGAIYTDLFTANGNLPWAVINGTTPDAGGVSDGIEIRNPKSLICVDGTKYDADTNAKELIGTSSPGYDSTNKDHVRTGKVRASLELLSTYLPNLQSMVIGGASTAQIKAQFAEYFDVQSIIDYLILSDFVLNTDGVHKNWQWMTWDGAKWFVEPYDLDGIFGWSSWHDVSPETAGHLGNTAGLPSKWVLDYFNTELEARYKELRDAGILTVKNTIGLFKDWIARIGAENYDAEHEKWPYDHDHYSVTDYADPRKDNIYRVQNWLTRRLVVCDTMYHYQ